MNRHQIIEGAKAGLEVGVRRGDLDLVKTCWDLMHDDERDPQAWITWRLPYIVQVEAFHMLGECARMEATLPDELDTEAAQLKFIKRLALAKKSKDVGALRFMVMNACQDDPLMDIDEFRIYAETVERLKEEPIETVADDLYETVRRELGVHGEYALTALKLLRGRALLGGKLLDRYNNLAAMVMIGSRGLDEDETQKDITKGARRWFTRIGEKRLPRTVELPWYVWGKDTGIGQQALRTWEREHGGETPGMTVGMVAALMHCLETTKTPVSMINYQDGKLRGFAPLDTVWWLDAIRWTLTAADETRKYTPKDQGELWREKIRGQLQEIIENLVEQPDP